MIFIPISGRHRGCSSVVERHVANVNVEGSNPFSRFHLSPANSSASGVPRKGVCGPLLQTGARWCKASPSRQAKPALELNSVWAGCLVTPLAENGKKVSQLNASITVDVGAAGHLGGGDDMPFL